MRVAHHESKMIWNDVAETTPDILLSIGTGMTSINVAGQMPSMAGSPPACAEGLKSSSKSFLLKDLWDIVSHRLHSALRCEEIWRRFVTETSSAARGGYRDNASRLIRINPDLRSTVPELDAVGEIKNLERAASVYLEQNWGKIREVGHRLIASSFFFDKERRKGLECSGQLQPVNSHSKPPLTIHPQAKFSAGSPTAHITRKP